MARELLRYRPANDLYEDWLGRIAELVDAPGEAPAPSRSLPPPLSQAGHLAHDAPPPLARPSRHLSNLTGAKAAIAPVASAEEQYHHNSMIKCVA